MQEPYEQVLQPQPAQPDPSTDPNALYADVMREEKVTNIIAQINPDNLMIDIEHRIRGEIKNPYTKQWEKLSEDAEPISNALVNNFVSWLGSILNQNTSLSNFSPMEINNIMDLVIEYVRDDLTDNDEKYNLVGKYTEMTRIATIICFTVFSVLKQAMNGMLSRRVFSSLRVTESTMPNQPKKRTLADAFKFW